MLANYFSFPFYIPRIVSLLRNWPLFLCNYALRRRKPAEYRFRNGLRILDATGTLAGTIAVVFIRREYGALGSHRVIIDIGANMGSFAIYAAQCRSDAKVYCYEPNPQNFEVLTRNVSVNGLGDRILASRLAVAATSGERDIGIGLSPTHSFVRADEADAHQKVTCTTLRQIFEDQHLDKVDFLKMNCEGAEYEILAGCHPADFERISNIRLEYHDVDKDQRNGKALSRLLEDHGYRIQRFSRYQETEGLFVQSGFIWATRT